MEDLKIISAQEAYKISQARYLELFTKDYEILTTTLVYGIDDMIRSKCDDGENLLVITDSTLDSILRAKGVKLNTMSKFSFTDIRCRKVIETITKDVLQPAGYTVTQAPESDSTCSPFRYGVRIQIVWGAPAIRTREEN